MTRLYGDHAALYDLIYHALPYGERAAELREVLEAHGVKDGARVLEAACGTGNYLAQLRKWYEVRGFDLSPEMVAIARAKLPEVPIHVADMRDFEVDEPVEPWLAPEELKVGQPFMHTYEDPDLKICRMAASQRDGDVALLDMHWMVARREMDVEYFVDRHEMWMPARETTLEVMAETGFDGRYEPEGAVGQRSLFVGVRR